MIAVTGANGYIGWATVQWLARQGPVVALARSAPSVRIPPAVMWRMTGHSAPQPAAFSGCDTVIHLAGRAHTPVSLINGQDQFDQANRKLALDTAIAAHAAGVQRFIFVSTLGVHGNWSTVPVNSSSALRLETPYARSKWAAEQALATFCASTGMMLCIVRPAMVYGPRCPGNFSRLFKLVASGIPLPFGSLQSVRSFIHVDNLASFLTACATSALPPHSIFVIGDGSDWSTLQLVRGITMALGRRSLVFPFPVWLMRLAANAVGRGRELDSLSRPLRIDSSAAYSACNWYPPIEPDSALSNTVRAYVE